ncbi:DNA replication ATP-dependent helicase/nuclease JHS1 isoform X1 [Dioscorea cayenensis subsp. rotundata]|uniref:DNA replication ATP-dependent helicase/nuclease n=1 Tax=Dioscorea cayennensis subsp. rotundata TaxID=55577 RepID=A0AB40B5G9_DIOCR|nr:DNA replication ATP-dependent helicase/nuclease JHS1 isoform X1 [Dioscorea cayenensis subsp. rotundata]
MAPRKRATSSSSSRKPNQPNQPSQPSKFGIQHFFERHSQSQIAAVSSTNPNPNPDRPESTLSPGDQIQPLPAPAGADVVENVAEISPEVSKSVSQKRFKFSPGMLIKQSQDDGGDEISWKISPMTERLKSLAEKKLPEAIKFSWDAARTGVPSIHSCSQKQRTSCPVSKPGKLPVSTTAVEAVAGNDHVSELQSPFRTPPSVSCGPCESIGGVTCNGVPDQAGSWQHRKALLELLDQVEDAISEESDPVGSTICTDYNLINNKMDIEPDAIKKGLLRSPIQKVIGGDCSDETFLVLEVMERHASSNGSCHHPFKVLRLLNEQTGQERALHLCDEWFYSLVGPGDTIIAIGEFDEQGKCVVDHDNNLIIIHPDILLSGTRVASSFNCPRRTVLDERLKCNEHSTSALVGTMLHQIFQAGLLKELPTRQFLEEYAGIVLKRNIESLYSCGANVEDVYSTLTDAIHKMLNWISCFRATEKSKTAMVDFGDCNIQKTVHITEVLDIEEIAWAPRYGLKGIIDASVRTKIHSSNGGSSEKIMPLEFKTGKRTSGQSAMEHSAQVILYTILMSERYSKEDIDSGLLYYLYTDQTRGIEVQRSDLVGLIMRRNELATDILKASSFQRFPPMLKNPILCKGCRQLNSCMIYHKAHGGNSESSGVGDLFNGHAEHLTVAYSNFLKHWDRLIDLEARSTQVAKKELLLRRSFRGGDNGNSISYTLDAMFGFLADGLPINGRFMYHFVRQNLSASSAGNMSGDQLDTVARSSNSDCSLRCGDYVILSTKSGHIAVANGIIKNIDQSRVTISLSRRLRLPWSNSSIELEDLVQEMWCIDKDEVSSSYAIMRFNIVQLFDKSFRSSHLRKMVVDLEVPRFDSGGIISQDPALSYLRSENNLNKDQRGAIQKILSAKDYALVLGMPGTGKTSTMVHAVKALLLRGGSILLTSYTNTAIDNLLLKLKAEDIDFVRIGRHEAIHDDIRGHCFSASETCTVEDIRERMEQVRIVGVTCLGINHPLLANKTFDICIMDEAGQITLPVSLGPLMLASTFVLVGDHYQLPPLVQSTEARENGMGVSLFCRLSEAHPQAISELQCQYRMSAGIMELSNALIYGERLRCGSAEIANSRLQLSGDKPTTLWLKEVLDPSRSVVFINTDLLPAPEVKDYKPGSNPMEAYVVSEVTRELVKRDICLNEIGIITPYNSQANLIRSVIDASGLVEVHTIDKYQGRDKDCILVSFVRSSRNSRACASSLLGDWHRINVALTRAKKKLIMVGSSETLSKIPLLKLLIEKVNEQGGIIHIPSKDFQHVEWLKKCSLKSV